MKLINTVKFGANCVLLGAVLGIPGVLALGILLAPQIALIQYMYEGIKMNEEKLKSKE